MPGHGLPYGFTVSLYKIENPGRKSGLFKGFNEQNGGKRRPFARLEHNRAAHKQRRNNLLNDLPQRVIPRRNGSDDTYWFTHDERRGKCFFCGNRPCGRNKCGRTFLLIEAVLASCESNRGTEFGDLQFNDGFRFFAKAPEHPFHQRDALRERRTAPTGKCALSRCDGGIHLFGRTVRNTCEYFTSRRIFNVNHGALRGCPDAVNVMFSKMRVGCAHTDLLTPSSNNTIPGSNPPLYASSFVLTC